MAGTQAPGEKNPSDVRTLMIAYLKAQEGKAWSHENTEQVMQYAAEFDDLIIQLMVAAGVNIEDTFLDRRRTVRERGAGIGS